MKVLMLSDKELLEKVIYTADLATTPSANDALLDKVRIITSRSSGGALNSTDRETLESVQKGLETYLIKREPLRHYTTESLQLQIEEHLQGGKHRRSLIHLATIVGLTLAVGLVVGFAPILSDNPNSHLQFTVGTMFSMLHLGALSLLLTALPAFKTQLRRAFITLCGGFALLTATFLLQPILELQGITSGMVALLLNSSLYFVASIFIYAGIRHYVSLVGVQSWALRVTPLIAAVAGATGISLIMQHSMHGVPAWAFDLAAILHGFVLFASIAATTLTLQAIRKLSEPFKPSMQALAQALIVTTATCVYIYFVRLTYGIAPRGPLSITAVVLVLLMGIALARAGYVFNKVSRY